MKNIQFSRINGLVYINIQLWNSNIKMFQDMLILVDTGASVTTISDTILCNLGYEKYSKTTNIITVMGITEVYTKTIAKLKIGAVELSDIDVYAYDFPDECFSDGVLGMNVLEKFNFKVNLDDNIIELEEREQL